MTNRSITIREGPSVLGPGLAGATKRFPAADHLALGNSAQDYGYDYMYRLADVRVGDKVMTFYDRVDGIDICTHVCIKRRPGGRVPPSPGEPADTRDKWHEIANASQDWEEKGIPLPDQFLPREQLLARLARRAPAPHVAIQAIPPAGP